MCTEININKQEVLRYLEYKGQDISDNLEQTIDECIELTKAKINPRYILRVYPILRTNIDKKQVKIKGSNIVLTSDDLYNLLDGCDECIVISATLGMDIEKEIKRNSYSQLTKSIIIDACATTAIEEVCDCIENDIKENLNDNNKYITTRYSPGYGDLSIEANKDIINILNCQREIGLTITESGIMLPRKSVIAIIGISSKRIEETIKSCLNCPNYEICKYRKGGKENGCKRIYKK